MTTHKYPYSKTSIVQIIPLVMLHWSQKPTSKFMYNIAIVGMSAQTSRDAASYAS